jgi:hypothetical protein
MLYLDLTPTELYAKEKYTNNALGEYDLKPG